MQIEEKLIREIDATNSTCQDATKNEDVEFFSWDSGNKAITINEFGWTKYNRLFDSKEDALMWLEGVQKGCELNIG